MPNLESALRTTMARRLLRYAVGRALFCRICGACLDYRRAVLTQNVCICGACYDRIRARAVAEQGEELTAQVEQERAATCDHIDGRKLAGR